MEDLQDKIIELMDLFDDEEVTTADKIDRPQRALDREAIDDFMKRNPMAGGGTIAGGNIQGEQIYDRFGFKLPRFVTKDPTNKTNPYRVKIKKSELNPVPFSGNFRTLKEAKEVASKYKAGVQGPSVNLQLIENAQSVVDDYNKIIDKAVANRNLTGVGYFETYVKNKFPNKSDQTKILRRVYDNKMDYRDLTQVRKTLAKDLINLAMEQEKIVPLQFVYDRLGATRSAKLSSDVQQIVNKGLKNQTKIKVDRAIQSIVEADEIIDDSLQKTVADRIGRSYTGGKKRTWIAAFKQNPYYKKNKKLLDYAFTAGGKSSRAPGMSLSEILDDAKYKIGGGVTFSGKQTQFAGLRRYIFDYAKSHWHRNNFDGNPGKSLIEFYDKNGKPIKWKPGLKLKLGEVQFKIPSESDVMWSYNGAPKGSVSVTGPIADSSGVFKEVTETYNVMKEISDAPVTNPVTGKETTYNKLVSDIYKKGYGYQGKNIFGLDIDHFKGVRDHPFKNLRAMDRRLNISLGAIDKTFDNRNLKAKLKNEILGELATTTGSNYNQALKTYFVNQATNVLDKGIAPTLATESPYYSAVKKVYEQKNLPKVQKELLEKSYQRATKLEQTLLNNLQARSKLKECKIPAADGGRIGFALSDECIRDGLNETKKAAAAGDKKAARQLVETAEAASKGGRLLKNILGPGALLGEAVFEGALIGNRLLEGKPLDQAWAESYLSYLDPRKYAGQLDPRLMERERMLTRTINDETIDGPNANLLRAGFAAQDQLIAANKAVEDRNLAARAGKNIRYAPAAADAREQAARANLSANIISSDAFQEASRQAREYLDAQEGKRRFDLGIFGTPQGELSEDRRMFEANKAMKNLYTQYSDDELRQYLKQSLGTDDDKLIDKYLDLTGVTERITPSVTRTLSGLDVLRTGLQKAEAMQNLMGGAANFATGGRAGFKLGKLAKLKKSKVREEAKAIIDDSMKMQQEIDTTTELDKLIKKTLDEDFLDKKDTIIDTLNAKIARERKNFPYNQQVFEEPSQLEFYDDITKSNFRTKTGPFFDYQKRKNKAGGGLLKQAGDRSGAPPVSGPNSQGLQGLLNRVKKT